MAVLENLFEVAPSAPGEWRSHGKGRFHQHDGSQFGGYLSGLMLTAVLAEPERSGAPVAMTGAFLSRAAAAPLTIKTTKLRAGNTLQFWRGEILQDEKLCAEATIVLARRPAPGPKLAWTRMPDAAGPESLPRNVISPKAPPHLGTFDQRIARGGPPYPADGVSWVWVKEEDGAEIDYPRLAMFADMFPPRVLYGAGEEMMSSSTISFSTYFHAPEEEIAKVGADYILLAGAGRKASRGLSDLTATLWRRDGFLLATTEQLCWFR